MTFAAHDAIKTGWILVSDTAWPGYDIVPRCIMAGCTMLISEAANQGGASGPGDCTLTGVPARTDSRTQGARSGSQLAIKGRLPWNRSTSAPWHSIIHCMACFAFWFGCMHCRH